MFTFCLGLNDSGFNSAANCGVTEASSFITSFPQHERPPLAEKGRGQTLQQPRKVQEGTVGQNALS